MGLESVLYIIIKKKKKAYSIWSQILKFIMGL